MSIGKLLIDDQPLQVLPSLAEAIGLNEALILQQIHWLLLRSKKEFKGKPWVFNTYEEWQEKHFRFFSISTIRRTINRLEELNLLISSTEFNQMKVDKTKWYTINYEALDNLAIATAKNDSPSVQNEQSSCSNWAVPSVQNEQTNNQENTQEIPNNNPLPPCGESADADVTEGQGDMPPDGNPLPDEKQKIDRTDYIGIAQAYNDALDLTGVALPRIADPTHLSDKRKRAVKKLSEVFKKRFGDGSASALGEYFADFMRSAREFYFGENNRGWKADFEFLLRENTLDKVLEGNL